MRNYREPVDLLVVTVRPESRGYSEPAIQLESFLRRPSWQAEAACRELDVHIFFPEKNGQRPSVSAKQVREICASCPVQDECLAYALERHEYGFWAGRSEKERKTIRRTSGLAVTRKVKVA